MRTNEIVTGAMLLACVGLLAACGGGGGGGGSPFVEERKGVQVTNETSWRIERREWRLFDAASGAWTAWVVEDRPAEGALPDETCVVWSSTMTPGPSHPATFPVGGGYTHMQLVLHAYGEVDDLWQPVRYERSVLFGEHLLALSVRGHEFAPAP